MGWNRQVKLTVSFVVLFWLLPFQFDHVNAQDGPVIPMGHSIGIQMELTGIFITNDLLIQEDTWLKSGDELKRIGEKDVSNVKEVEQLLPTLSSGSSSIFIQRNGQLLEIKADGNAVKRLLPFLKDKTEGTGTLTYVDPTKGTYGALGHQIVDSSLNSPPSFKNGAIYLSEINQIKKSVPGVPGYKISTIVESEDYLGTIQTNGIYGIFGAWNRAYEKVLAEPLEIMQPNELQVGEAEIFTTVKDTTVESFTIQITKVTEDQFHFNLTDATLMKATGGILQGMSGSPVIQNGQFVGAVTHMFVDEPEKGAGIFLETMRDGEE